MKNYQLKLILAFFIFGLIIITVMGLVCASVFQLNQPKMIAIIVIALVILAIVCIAMAFFTVKKVIEPMSRMLKGAVSYRYFDYNASENGNDEIENLVADLRKSLMEANSQKRQTDTILKHMTDGVIAFDMKGNVTYINPAAKQMLELRDTDDNFAKVFSKYEDVNMEKIIYLENWTSSEMKIENNQGSMNLFFVPFKDEINRPTGVMVVIQDITEHVKLDDMRKEFVADVSHELKTPLTSIKGFSETLLEGDCDKETEKHFLTIINDNADRMEKLVQDLLTLSRYDSKKNKNSIVEFDLGELAKKCTEKFEIEVRKRNQSLECFVTADVPPVQADKDGIERVIINIISNSVKYTPNGGKINVYVGYVHNDAYVKIKDTGIGIPKDDLDKVFERFYRVDKARSRKLGGTGLGLSIAKEIIEQNNGNINVSSKVGQGTEVVIRIPVKKS
jgi:two-component system sensor histidine kinase VicK